MSSIRAPQARSIISNRDEAFALFNKLVPTLANGSKPSIERGENNEKLSNYLADLITDRTTPGGEPTEETLGLRNVALWPEDHDWLASLRMRFPHFEPVIHFLECHQALANLADAEFQLPPILLAGPPGVGKTRFAYEVAQFIQVPFVELSMGSATAGWILSGMDMTWANAKPGRVFDTLSQNNAFNPIMLLDEIDKVSAMQQHRPDAALYTLLEASSAKRFKDESVPVSINASGIAWIGTANDVSTMDKAILSRFTVFDIPIPNLAQRMSVVQSVYSSILASEPWGKAFPERLDVGLAEEFAGPEEGAREVKARLLGSLGHAAIRGSTTLASADIPRAKQVEVKRSIGFM